MDINERLAIEAECTRLVNAFCWHLDAFDYEDAIALFVPDCTVVRVNEVYEGHEGARKVLNSRAPDRRTCHLLNNMVVDVIDRDNAQSKAHCTIFGHRGQLKEDEPAPLGVPDSVGRFEARFRRTDAGWRMTKLHIIPNFSKPAP